ncbi:MAG TPA: hypothetical protein VOA80_09300, partial [Thermoanaerobaculia bacterium]|nr:hypothetical protein [Thermoanaerobaculia bacterium]
LPAPTAYLVTSLLQGAVDHGTGSAVRRQGLADPLAGKTGTTNDRRDSWFAGYSPDRVTVVWVGYDDDAETRFSGATAAVPLWSRFMLAVRPAGGFPGFARPPGLIDAEPAEAGAATTAAPLVMPASFHESMLEAPAGGTAWYEPSADPAANGDRRGVILIRRHGGP